MSIVGQLPSDLGMKRIITACCLVLIGNFAIAYAQRVKPRTFDPLLSKLVSVKWLSNHDPGFGGGNEFYKLSEEFLKTHDPSDFRRMVHDRNPIVRAMGLLCLAQVDGDKDFLTLLSHWKDEEEVYLHQGCVVSKLTIAEFTQRLLINPYFLDPEGKRPAM